MSVTKQREIPCRTCGEQVSGLTVESANPIRHPPFQERLLNRTLLRMTCPHCGADHEHYERFMWTDLPGRLCVIVLHQSERPGWPSLEIEAHEALRVPFREEGPFFVRLLGEETDFRLAFGLEELREKVVCRIHSLDDRVVEALKEDLAYGCLLDDARPGISLTFLDDERRFEVGWQRYDDAAARAVQLAAELPGLYDPLTTWVNAARAHRAPQRDALVPPSLS
jgi:hypothetical protein